MAVALVPIGAGAQESPEAESSPPTTAGSTAATTPSTSAVVPADSAVVPADSAVVPADDPIPGRYIVTLADGPSVDAADVGADLAADHGGQVAFTYEAALTGFAVSGLTEDGAAELAADPRVTLVEEDGRVDALELGGDGVGVTEVQEGATWGLDRIDQRDLPRDNRYEYLPTGDGVTVYVIDTGIRFSHQDFGGRASNGVDLVGGGQNGNDCAGHGTHVAGTVGGERWGVAKEVTLKAVRVLNCSGSSPTSRVIAGVDWVTANAVHPAVVNMSLGGGASTSMNNAVAASVASGVTYAVAAGNSNANACNYSPASTPSAITVGSTTSSDARSSFSNFGTCVDIFAPGSSITSAWISSDTSTNTISGTSMASPHVAGVAALYLDEHPTDTPALVADAITGGATPGKVGNPGSGSPNLLLYSGFVVSVPALVVEVDAQPNAPQDFTFSGCGPGGCSDFALDDDTDPTLPNSRIYGGVPAGDYTIEWGPVDLWRLDGLTCDGDHAVDEDARRLTVTVPADRHVTCTFTYDSAAITVVKDTAPNDPQDFTFTRCGPSGPCDQFTLDDDGNAALPNRMTFAGLEPGSWSVAEGAVPGWLLTGLTCDGDHTADQDERRVTVDLDPGEHVTCTFTNGQAAITVAVDTDPASGRAVGFAGCGPSGCGQFTLDDGGGSTLPDSVTFAGLDPGSYTVTQDELPGWGLMSLTCDTGETVDLAARRVTIELTPGERTRCTFTNRETAITVVTQADPANGDDFVYRGCGPLGCGDFSLDHDADATLPDTVRYGELTPGPYSLTQQADPDWVLADLACTPIGDVDLGQARATMTLVPGDQVTCTYTNASTAITIVQDTAPNNGQDFGYQGCITGTALCSTFSLDDDGNATLPSTSIHVGLPTGSFTITQDEVNGWRLHDIRCDSPEAVEVGARQVTISLEAGDHTTCTFVDVDPTRAALVNYSTGTYEPWDVAGDSEGRIWVTLPAANRVGRLDPGSGEFVTFPTGVTSPRGITLGPDGNIWLVGWQSDSMARIDPDTGNRTNFSTGGVEWPWSITAGPDGNLWAAGRLCDCVGRINPATGQVTTFWSGVNDPLDPTVGPDGNIWVVGYLDDQAARIVPATGSVTHFSLSPGIRDPHNLAIGGDGNLWVTGYLSDSIARIDVTTLAVTPYGLTGVDGADGLAPSPSGQLWAVGHHSENVARFDPHTAAQTRWPTSGVAGPTDLAAAPDGSLWLSGIDAPYTVSEVVLPTS